MVLELGREEVKRLLLDEARATCRELGAGIMRELERVILLRTVDRHWMYYIDEMHQLRRRLICGLTGRDHLVEYRLESFEMFEGMIRTIQGGCPRNLYSPRGRLAAARSPAAAIRPRLQGNAQGSVEPGRRASPAGTTLRASARYGKDRQKRAMPCGSGKSIKCCGA